MEHAICSDRWLSHLDEMLSADFAEALRSLPEMHAELLSDERRWVKLRDARCAALSSDIRI